MFPIHSSTSPISRINGAMRVGSRSRIDSLSFNFSQKPLPPMLLHEHPCPTIAKRPKLRTYGVLAATVGGLGLLLLLLFTAYLVAARPGLARRMIKIWPGAHIALGSGFMLTGLALIWYVARTWNLPH
jgi:hypothetical protein